MLRCLIVLLAVLSPCAAHADWHEASSNHFLVYADAKPEVVAKFASDLERFDQAVRQLRGIPDTPVGPANRVTVFMVGSVAEVGRLARRNDVAGYYQPRSSGSLAIVPRRAATDQLGLGAQPILFHEYAHHLMLTNFANSAFPAWLVEGWAEYHATAKILPGGVVQFGATPAYRGWGLMTGNPLPLPRMLAGDTVRLTESQQDALYGRGWLLTHYLTNTKGRGEQFGNYITAINSGKTAKEAMAAFGDLNVLGRELEKYLSRTHFPGVNIGGLDAKLGKIIIRRLSPGEQATMSVRIRSKNGVSAETAPPVYAAAKRAATPFPTDSAAQLVLAEAAYDAKDYAEAEAAASRAVAANPQAVRGYVYKAMAKMAIARAAKDASKESWSAIRKVIVAGNRIDPDDPEPLILFFRSYVEAGQAPSANAKTGLYTAFTLAPQDRELRINTAATYLADGKPDMARALLRPLAFDPHGGPMAAAATKLIAEIDSRNIPRANKDMEIPPKKTEGAAPTK